MSRSKKGTSKGDSSSRDETDLVTSSGGSNLLAGLLERLDSDPGHMAILSGRQLEVLAEMDTKRLGSKSKFRTEFLDEMQEAAHRHLAEKNEIRDALGLLKLYHHAHPPKQASKVTAASGKH